VVVVDASGVDVDGVAVGRDNPAFVGGRVAVTKEGGTAVVASGAILMHDVSIRLATRSPIQIFFMDGFYLEFMKPY
jgi:hypothetical protein